MGSAFSKWYSANGYMAPSGTIDEELLHKLLMKFPQGRIFNSIQGINVEVPILDADPVTRALLNVFSDASSLIFLPLWKCDKTKCLAAMIVWTCEPSRTFKDDDLYYLKAAGNMVVLEITQADHSALEKSNFDPLSSMSHELRSPLHGVLANAELLQSTTLDPAQRDMVTTVETCGEMLLDSLNNL
jgi:signal transduction histidine kinase